MVHRPRTWRRSSFCANNGCIEVEFAELNTVLVRSSKHQENTLIFTEEEWRAFIEGAKRGEFDVPQ